MSVSLTTCAANMLAIDTNVLVRLLVRDHPEQTARAEALIQQVDVSISTTVVLETAWVLAGPYGQSCEQIATGLTDLFGLPRISLQNPAAVQQALLWFRGGLDFADALHLAQADDSEGFATFDRRFAKAGEPLGATPIRLL